jgi:hypothetical protein
MDRNDCEKEKISSRTVGILMIPLALFLGVIGGLIVPVFGLFFSLPLFVLAIVFIAAPESRVCRVLLRKET